MVVQSQRGNEWYVGTVAFVLLVILSLSAAGAVGTVAADDGDATNGTATNTTAETTQTAIDQQEVVVYDFQEDQEIDRYPVSQIDGADGVFAQAVDLTNATRASSQAKARSALPTEEEQIDNNTGVAAVPTFFGENLERVLGGEDDRVHVEEPWDEDHGAIVYVDGSCTGVLVSEIHVLTAAHCITDHDNDQEWQNRPPTIFPGHDQYSDNVDIWPYNRWSASYARVYSGWLDDGLQRHDMALLTLDNSVGEHLRGDYFEYQPVGTDDPKYEDTEVTVAGYPSETLDSNGATHDVSGEMWKDDGETMGAHCRVTGCFEETTLAYQVDTSKGQSGAPVVADFGGDPSVVAVNSGTYTDPAVELQSWGPRITEERADHLDAWIATDRAATHDAPDTLSDSPEFIFDRVHHDTIWGPLDEVTPVDPTLAPDDAVVLGKTELEIGHDIRNRGTERGETTARYYLAEDDDTDPGNWPDGHRIGETTHELDPFSATRAEFTGTVEDVPPGQYYVIQSINRIEGRKEHYVHGRIDVADVDAAFTWDPDQPAAGDSITFDASASKPTGSVGSYEWDLTGDGSVDAVGQTIEHVYDDPGQYEVTLTVTDADGRTDSVQRTVEVIESVEGYNVTATATVDPSRPDPGDRIELTGQLRNHGDVERAEVPVEFTVRNTKTNTVVFEETAVYGDDASEDPILADPSRVVSTEVIWDTDGVPEGTYVLTVNARVDRDEAPATTVDTVAVPLFASEPAQQYDLHNTDDFCGDEAWDGACDDDTTITHDEYTLTHDDVLRGSPPEGYEYPDTGDPTAFLMSLGIERNGIQVVDANPDDGTLLYWQGEEKRYASQPRIYDGGDLALYVDWATVTTEDGSIQSWRLINVMAGDPASKLSVDAEEPVTTPGKSASYTVEFEEPGLEDSMDFLGDVAVAEGWELDDTERSDGTHELSVTPPDDISPGSYSHWIQVGSHDYIFEMTVRVEEEPDPASFEIEAIEPREATVTRGNSYEADVRIKNTGGQVGTQTIEFTLQGEEGAASRTEEVTLEPGETRTVGFEIDTTDLKGGTYSQRAATADDTERVAEAVVIESGTDGSITWKTEPPAELGLDEESTVEFEGTASASGQICLVADTGFSRCHSIGPGQFDVSVTVSGGDLGVGDGEVSLHGEVRIRGDDSLQVPESVGETASRTVTLPAEEPEDVPEDDPDTPQEAIVVNAKANGATADIGGQSTWKGEAVNIIDEDRSTKWQIRGQPDNITAEFRLDRPARVRGDFIDISGTGGNRELSEYVLYVRNTSAEPWEHAVTVDGSVTADGTGSANHTFDSPVVGQQFRLVLTDHRPPSGCLSVCDVPLAEYHLHGEFVSVDRDGGVVSFADGTPTLVDLLDGIRTYDSGGTVDGQEVRYDDVLGNIRAFNAGTSVPGPVSDGAATDVAVSVPDSVQPGETFTVEYELTNTGTEDANAAGLEVTPPPGVRLDGAETIWATALERESVFVTDGLSAGGSETVTLEFAVADDVEPGRGVTIEGVATVGGEDADASATFSVGDDESDDGDGGTGLSATRTVESRTVPAGGSTAVTVTIRTAVTTGDLRFTERFNSSLEASVIDDDGATISSAASDEVAASWGGVSEATITYEMTVPDNVPDGTTYDLSGTVEDRDAGSEVSIEGDTTIEVGEPTAVVDIKDQSYTDSTDAVTVANAMFTGGDFAVAIHDTSEGSPGPVVGWASLHSGVNAGVTVTLDQPLSSNVTVTAMLYESVEGGPITSDGSPVTDTASVTIREASDDPIDQFRNDEGVVDAPGLLEAAAAFRDSEIDSQILLDVAAEFRAEN